MALKDLVSLGMVLPHRSPDPLSMDEVRQTAQRAEALGFADLWVTENTLDHAYSLDPVVALTYAAAVTTRIRVGVSVLVLPLHHPVYVAHQIASLDFMSGGRAILGLGIGGAAHYHDFGVPTERRVRRFSEGIEVIRALWRDETTEYHGQVIDLPRTGFRLKPIQDPGPPIWLGGAAPAALERAARIGDAWMGSGNSSVTAFAGHLQAVRDALERAGRDPAKFPTSKRIFMSVHEDASVARTELLRWFTEVYRNAGALEASGVYGTPEQVRERLEEIAALEPTHLLLNPVTRFTEQVEALAEVAGLK